MQHCLTDILIFLKKLVLLFVISTWYSISFGQTTYTVTSIADTPDANLSDNICADANGDCTFRAALQNANKTPQKDIIAFNIPGQGPFYIRPDGIYNNIIQPLIIDGTTQPGWSEGKPVVVIDGSNVPIRQVGLRIMNNASGCIIRGLVMGGYRPGEDWRNGFAILIQTNDNTIEGSYFGIDADGETALPNNRGIQIMNGSNNTIGGLTLAKRNVISGNLGIGVAIFGNQPPEGFAGPNSLNNLIIGNYIGIDANGSSAVGNSINLQITYGAEKTTIEKNIISGATSRGVVLASAQTIDTKIIGNYIGTDASGLEAIPNQVHGINLLQGVNRTTIGGSRPEERNIISGNGSFGISFQFSRASPGTIPVTGNLVIGNYIGLDVNGEALPNQNGIQITGLSENNTIGGTEDNERNVISGNLREGILISGSNANENKIRGNFIGTDVSGTTAIGNRVGVYISEGNGTSVGGTDLG